MAIPRTNLQKDRVTAQVTRVLLNLQRAMRNNAETHKAMAQAQSPDFVTLKGFVDGCAATYIGNLRWIFDLRANPTKRQRLIDSLGLRGWTESDIVDVETPLRTAATALRDAPRENYADIITSSDALLAFVTELDTLWPE